MKKIILLFFSLVCAMSAWAEITPSKPATLVTAENAESLGLEASYEGYYAIANADQLYWFAGLVNGDFTVCDGVSVKQDTYTHKNKFN
ncbi:MAG: hypothetical protein MJZ28_12390 [Paludibacteraceae bacterium]|nr:hypothetical protein [Paludibacteraceae bacterium]MCQ2217308.1 hypothetical protein [Paludibacteraceae bacterium]